MSNSVTKWIFPSKHEYFDVLGAFARFGQLDWGTNNNVSVGDIVYIYIGEPIYKIMLETVVTKVNVSDEEIIDDTEFYRNKQGIGSKNKYVRLKLVKTLFDKKNYLLYEELMKNGLNGHIQGTINLSNNHKLQKYIELVTV